MSVQKLKHSVIIEVPFFDVDSMEIVWHGHYVKYMELARCAFLKQLNYDYDVMKQHGYGWPVVQLQLKYIRPAQFGQKIRVEVTLKEYESCLKFDYLITDVESGQKLSKASTMQMVVKIEGMETQFQTPISFREKINKALIKGIEPGAIA